MAREYRAFTVTPEENDTPVKKIIRRKFHFSSRLMTKIKYQDLIEINGERAPGWALLNTGDEVKVYFPKEKSGFSPEDIPISVLYEDEDLLLINKQAGITVHPTKGHPAHTIANGLMRYMEQSGDSFKIRFVNRLDMDTSGVLIVAKNARAQAALNEQMLAGITAKEYLAFCRGIWKPQDLLAAQGTSFPSYVHLSLKENQRPFDNAPNKTAITSKLSGEPLRAYSTATAQESLSPLRKSAAHRAFTASVFQTANSVLRIEAPIGRRADGMIGRTVLPETEGGQMCITEVNLLFQYPDAFLCRCCLLTGRTHQIRVHLSGLGHPLLGDTLYGEPSPLLPRRHALHAYSFAFTHPVTQKRLCVRAPLPPELLSLHHTLLKQID